MIPVFISAGHRVYESKINVILLFTVFIIFFHVFIFITIQWLASYSLFTKHGVANCISYMAKVSHKFYKNQVYSNINRIAA